MSAYKDAFVIDATASDQRLAMAAEILSRRQGVVMLDGLVALHAEGSHLLCEVIDPTPSAHRCAMEYEVLVENAQRALAASKLGHLLADVSRSWRVVEDRGTEIAVAWSEP